MFFYLLPLLINTKNKNNRICSKSILFFYLVISLNGELIEEETNLT